MNILLTGATGFLGSTIAHLLVKDAAKNMTVFGIVRDTSDTSRLADILSHKNFKRVSPTEIENVLKEKNIDAIIHTAASYGRQGESLAQIEQTNVYFPLNLLKLATENGVKAFINSDTFLEPSKTDDRNYNYVYTKKEFIAQAKKVLTPSIKFINMKIEQMYGPNDNPTKFMPFLVTQFLSGKERIPLNPGLQKRDYVYVDDVAEAYFKAAVSLDKLSGFEDFGLGSGQTNTLQEFVYEIKKATKSVSVPGFGDIPYGPNEVMSSVACLDNNYKINWKAHTPLQTGVEKTVEFYKKNL